MNLNKYTAKPKGKEGYLTTIAVRSQNPYKHRTENGEPLMTLEEKIDELITLTEAKPPKGTLYIKNSSIFDNPANKYDIPLFSKTLKKAGAKKVWSEPAFGWSNQPEVVLFTGLSVDDAAEALRKLPGFKKWSAIIANANRDWD